MEHIAAVNAHNDAVVKQQTAALQVMETVARSLEQLLMDDPVPSAKASNTLIFGPLDKLLVKPKVKAEADEKKKKEKTKKMVEVATQTEKPALNRRMAPMRHQGVSSPGSEASGASKKEEVQAQLEPSVGVRSWLSPPVKLYKPASTAVKADTTQEPSKTADSAPVTKADKVASISKDSTEETDTKASPPSAETNSETIETPKPAGNCFFGTVPSLGIFNPDKTKESIFTKNWKLTNTTSVFEVQKEPATNVFKTPKVPTTQVPSFNPASTIPEVEKALD